MAEFNVYFNGEKLPIRVLGGFTRGPMVGEYENKTIDISDMDGTEVISSRIKEGVIEVPFVIQGDLHTAHDEMMRILNVDEPKKLQFSDQMDRFYLAIPQGKPDAEELVQWFEKGSISFLVPSGVAYAEEETIVTNDREVVTETFVIDGVQGTGSLFDGQIKTSFAQEQYDELVDPSRYVRSETNIVDCGAEIQFKFNVIQILETKYPNLFSGLTTIKEKEARLHDFMKNVTLISSCRGGGMNEANIASSLKYYLIHILASDNKSTWRVTTGAVGANDFNNKQVKLTGSYPKQMNDGNYVIYISSKKNGNSDNGAISDGITPAWVEVKDVKLEIELELPRKQTLIINNEGTHKTAPEFSFDFEEDNGYIGVVHQDGIIQYGSPSEVDGVTKQKSVVLLQDRFDNNKGWEINSNKAVTMLPMTANGAVKWDPNQSFVYPTDFGTGTGWHGVTLTQALPEEANNFTLESLSRIQDIWAEKAGRLEFTISAADGTRLFTIQFRDDSVSSSQNQFWAYVGNQEVDRDTSTWRWRWWLGSLTVRKAGNLWEWTIQNGHNKWTRQYLDGGYAVSNKKAARITIAFAAFGDKKPIAWEDVAKNKSGMGWSELRFVKDNVDYWVDLPNKMKAGDTVEIRSTEGKIYKYWQNQEPIQDMLDADIGNNYFLLPVGESEVQFHFSDYMSEPPLITAKYRKTYR